MRGYGPFARWRDRHQDVVNGLEDAQNHDMNGSLHAAEPHIPDSEDEAENARRRARLAPDQLSRSSIRRNLAEGSPSLQRPQQMNATNAAGVESSEDEDPIAPGPHRNVPPSTLDSRGYFAGHERSIVRDESQTQPGSSSTQMATGLSMNNWQHFGSFEDDFITTNAGRELRPRRALAVTSPLESQGALVPGESQGSSTMAPLTRRKRKAQTPSPARQDSRDIGGSKYASMPGAWNSSSTSEKDTTDNPLRNLLSATSVDGPSVAMRYSTDGQALARSRTVITALAYARPDHYLLPGSGISQPRTRYYSLAPDADNLDMSQSFIDAAEWDESVRVKTTQHKAKQPRSTAAQSPACDESDIFTRLASGDRRWKGKGKATYRDETTPRPDLSQPPERIFQSERIPVEIFEFIVAHVSWTDIKNMRLVDHIWEDRVSPSLFKQVVVPFNPQVYGTLGPRPTVTLPKEIQSSPSTKPVSIDLDIFPGFGQHIRQFGMSFDLDQYALANPPIKNLQEGLDSFWGFYKWPFHHYRRFEDRAELEVAADETQIMKQAFSHLTKANHLGLVLDCGLGWLNGPDCSIRATVLKGRSRLFGTSHAAEQQTLDQRALWQQLEELHSRRGTSEALKSAEIIRHFDPTMEVEPTDEGKLLGHSLGLSFVSHLPNDAGIDLSIKSKTPIGGIIASTRQSRSLRDVAAAGLDRFQSRRISADVEELLDDFDDLTPPPQVPLSDSATTKKLESGMITSTGDGVPRRGILYTRQVINNSKTSFTSSHVLIPGTLTASQKEWLLETAWAQEAFLSSYMIAVTDNSTAFAQITKLTLSKISSRHIGKLCRPDFWGALSGLKELDLKVIADYRDVQKTHAGFATVVAIEPSAAVTNVHYLLQNHVASMEQLETLSVGWTDGGEHAEGVIARNRLLMPAPILPKINVQSADALPVNMLKLPHIKHLELVNCWITPNALEAFVLASRQHDLEKLTLTSVSMTMHPRFRGNNVQNGLPNLQGFLAQQLAQLPLLQPALAAAAAAGGGAVAGFPAVGGIHIHAMHGQQQANAVIAQVHQTLQQLANNHVAAPQINQAIVGAVQQLNLAANNVLGQHGAQNLINALNVQAPAPLGAGLPAPPNLNINFNLNQAQIQNQNQNQQQAQQGAQQGAREGSWANVFERVRQALTQVEKTDFTLQLFSCGYARLGLPQFDQSLLDQVEGAVNLAQPLPASRTAYATARKAQFEHKLIQTQDGHLASLSTALPGGEMANLQFDWGLEAGWPSKQLLGDEYDDDGGWGRWGEKSKQAAEFDGCRAGGSGRFSGRITNWVALSEDDG